MASLISRIAKELIQDNGWTKEQAENSIIGGRAIEGPFWEPVRKKVKKLSPQTLGVIAFSGVGSYDDHDINTVIHNGLSLYQVHCGTWLGKYDSGKEILRTVAITAIICEIYNFLCGR